MKKMFKRLNSKKRMIRSLSNVSLSNFLINYLFGTSPEEVQFKCVSLDYRPDEIHDEAVSREEDGQRKCRPL